MQRCLVTGGAGFIGSHLVDYLVAENRAVTILDDMSTGMRANLSEAQSRGDVRLVQRLGSRPSSDRGGSGGM